MNCQFMSFLLTYSGSLPTPMDDCKEGENIADRVQKMGTKTSSFGGKTPAEFSFLAALRRRLSRSRHDSLALGGEFWPIDGLPLIQPGQIRFDRFDVFLRCARVEEHYLLIALEPTAAEKLFGGEYTRS